MNIQHICKSQVNCKAQPDANCAGCFYYDTVKETAVCACCNLAADPGSEYCGFCNPSYQERFRKAVIRESAGLHSEYDI